MQHAHTMVTEQTKIFIARVFNYMALALVISGVTAFATAQSPALLNLIFGNSLIFFGLIGAELGLVIWLSARYQKMSADGVRTAFFAYAVLTGLTLSSIFIAFSMGSIVNTFFVTAATFGVMGWYGYTTKTDLTTLGNLLFMALIGIIIASISNFFFQSSQFDFVISCLGVVVFSGLTGYHFQKLKQASAGLNITTEHASKMAIMGALSLYLDFINLFLSLLRLMGSRD